MLVMALALMYVFSIPSSENVVLRSGSVVKFYKVKENDSIYFGCVTLEDTTISNKMAQKVFESGESRKFIYDKEKGLIKKKPKTPQD